MLLVNNINFYRNNKIILKDVNLSLSNKKILYLSGSNGAGKTTLLKILCNILVPQEGEIFWNGKNIKKNPFEYYKNITYIMDNQTSNKYLTTYENIFFWRKLFSSTISNDEIDSILDLLSLKKYKDIQVNYLSYGEKKKLELLGLIIEKKKLWILDEPYLGLDEHSVSIINQTILNHIELHGMMIFTSHIRPDIKEKEIEELKLENNE